MQTVHMLSNYELETLRAYINSIKVDSKNIKQDIENRNIIIENLDDIERKIELIKNIIGTN